MPIMIPYFGLHRLCQNNIDEVANSMPIFKNITTFTLCAGMVFSLCLTQDATIGATHWLLQNLTEKIRIFFTFGPIKPKKVITLNTAEKVEYLLNEALLKLSLQSAKLGTIPKALQATPYKKPMQVHKKPLKVSILKFRKPKKRLAGKPSQVAPIEQHS